MSNVWKHKRRICNLILGLKELKGNHVFEFLHYAVIKTPLSNDGFLISVSNDGK